MGATLIKQGRAGPRLMSALGQKRTLEDFQAMSALPPKADIGMKRGEGQPRAFAA